MDGDTTHTKIIAMLEEVLYVSNETAGVNHSICSVSVYVWTQTQHRLLELGAHIATPRDKATPTKLGVLVLH